MELSCLCGSSLWVYLKAENDRCDDHIGIMKSWRCDDMRVTLQLCLVSSCCTQFSNAEFYSYVCLSVSYVCVYSQSTHVYTTALCLMKGEHPSTQKYSPGKCSKCSVNRVNSAGMLANMQRSALRVCNENMKLVLFPGVCLQGQLVNMDVSVCTTRGNKCRRPTLIAALFLFL